MKIIDEIKEKMFIHEILPIAIIGINIEKQKATLGCSLFGLFGLLVSFYMYNIMFQ